MPVVFFIAVLISFFGVAIATSNHPTPPSLPSLPTPMQSVTETPTLVPTVKGVNTYQSTEALIDCVGPDGKHLRITQKACDDFNSAWNNKPQYQQGNNSYVNNNVPQFQDNRIQCQTLTGVYFISPDLCAQWHIDDQKTQAIFNQPTNQPYPTIEPYVYPTVNTTIPNTQSNTNQYQQILQNQQNYGQSLLNQQPVQPLPCAVDASGVKIYSGSCY